MTYLLNSLHFSSNIILIICSDSLKLKELDDVVKNREYYDCDDITLTIHNATLKIQNKWLNMAICQLVSPDFYWRVYRYCKISQKPQPSHCIHFLRKEDKIDKKSGSLVIDEGSPEGHWTNGCATQCQKRWHSKIRLDKNTLNLWARCGCRAECRGWCEAPHGSERRGPGRAQRTAR